MAVMDKVALDRWLTQTPEEYYGIDVSWFEEVWNNIPEKYISQETYDKHEKWFDRIEEILYDKYFNGEKVQIGEDDWDWDYERMSPEMAATIIVIFWKQINGEYGKP